MSGSMQRLIFSGLVDGIGADFGAGFDLGMSGQLKLFVGPTVKATPAGGIRDFLCHRGLG